MEDGSAILLQILVRCIFGGACAAIAHSKGRNAWGWFFGGFFIACIGLVIIICLSNLKEIQELARVQEDTNRRLREQLRQEQMKLNALRAHTSARLDAHDEALNLNTRAAAPALMSSTPPQARLPGNPNPMPQPVTPLDDGTAWYFHDETAGQQGPMSIIGMRSAILGGKIKRETLVWYEGLADWAPASQQEKLARLFIHS